MALFRRKRKSAVEEVAPEPVPTLPDLPADGRYGMRPWQAHRDWILDQIEPLPAFGMQLLDALDLTLCENIVADLSLPGFDNSSMDGYAVRADDVRQATEKRPAVLAVVGEIPAGSTADRPLAPGTALKIMTGAPIPIGADAVVPYELTDRGTDDVHVFTPVAAGDSIRRAGSDIREGDELLRVGDRIDARTVGLLAGVGIDKVMARPRPRVVVLATGSELVEPGIPLGDHGELYDSNSYLLAAAAKSAGAQVFRVGSVGDDPEAMRQAISDQQVRADLIVTSGGISMGDWDVVKQVAPDLGRTDFCQVAMQPGKPQGFGLIGEDNLPILMLPGNPVSSFVSFEAFVRPVIRKLLGAQPYVREPVRALTRSVIRSPKEKAQFLRAHLSTDPAGVRVVDLVGGPGSHLLGNLQKSNALVIVDDEVELIPAGDPVEVWALDE